jgi:hypothetical protein
LVGTDVENQKATVNIPIAAIVDLAIDYFSVNGNGDGINQSLLDITTTLDGNTEAIATYQNIVNTYTDELQAVVTRQEELESVFETNDDGTITLSIANITNFAETIASEGFAQATTVDSLSSQVQQIIDGQLTIDTYATIDQLAQTTSTLEGSIALLEDTLTAGYQAYTDGILTTDSFATAVSGIVAEAGADFSQSSQWTNLQSSFGTFNADGTLNTLSDAFANDVLSTYSGPDLATAQSVTDLGAEFGTFDANGNLTGLSNALSSQITTTIAGEGYATSSDLSTLESTLTSYIDGEIASSSTAGITGSQLTTVLADYALAQTVTDLNAQIFDTNGNVIDAFATSLLQTTAGNGLASSQSVTALESTVNGNTATLTQTASTVSDINGKLQSSYGLNLTAGDAIAGMTFLADGQTSLSEIKFVANTFKIDRPGGAISPFIVNADGTISLNGQVTFSNASTGQGIDFDDLSTYLTQNNYTTTSDLPDTSAFLDETALQAYLDDQGYQVGAGMDTAQLATYLTNGGYITTSTTINGGQISTGIIASGNYQHATTPTEGFSDQGMAINLDNGSIHAEQFYINNDGTANFAGTHSAGSIGSWVVGSNGQLQSSSTSPAIVLSPNSGTAGAGEKIRISATNLSTISPNAGSSMYFALYYLDDLSSESLEWSGIGTKTTSSGTWSSATGGSPPYPYSNWTWAYNKYVSLPDKTFHIDSSNTENNTPYTQPASGTALFTVPYNGGVDQANIHFMVQEQFLYDHGARWEHDMGGGAYNSWEAFIDSEEADWNRSNLSWNSKRIITWDYKIYFTAQVYRKNGTTKTPVGTEKQHLLKQGDSALDLNDFDPMMYFNQYQLEVWDFMDELIPAFRTSPHHYANKGFGTWEAGHADFSEYLTAGDYVVDFKYKVRVYNIKAWGTSTHGDAGYMPGTRYYAFTEGGWANTSESGANQVIFKGAPAQTAIGLNGTQIVGYDGYIALGDITSTNSIAQFWGDVDIIGGLSVNTTSA